MRSCYPLLPRAQRLLDRIVRIPESGCWIWMTGTNNEGYGRFYDDDAMYRLAHRVSYEVHVSPIPDGLEIDHLCRVRCCINPDHLEPVTGSVNVNRGLSAQTHRDIAAAITHCPKGHPYSGDNLYVRPSGNGNRSCKACNTDRMRAFRLARNEASAAL